MRIRYFSLSGIVLVSIVLMVGGGCKSHDAAPGISIVEDRTTVGSELPIIVSIPSPPVYPVHESPGFQYFDWEASDVMPSPSGTTPIPAPWSAEAKISFSEDIRYDIKKEDGWELYMNSFNTEFVITGSQNIILYNKYRGVLRFYEFNLQSVSDDLSSYSLLGSQLFLSGTDPSPLLNFSGNEVINVQNDQERVFSLEPQPLIESGWQAFEFELAFDKNIYSKSYENTSFYFTAGMLKPLTVEINGMSTDALTARISSSDLAFTNASGSSYMGNGFLNLRNQSELQGAQQFLTSNDFTILSDAPSGKFSDQFLNGEVQNNNAFGLNWISKFNLTCEPNRVGILLNFGEYVSGANNTMGAGPPVYYQDAPGVFYLDQTPLVTHSIAADGKTHQYLLDVRSVKYVFNPAVTSSAEIENITQEVIGSAEGIWTDGKRNKLFSGQKLSSNLPITIQGVRVSFDVVPHEGSSKVHIVKTFAAAIMER